MNGAGCNRRAGTRTDLNGRSRRLAHGGRACPTIHGRTSRSRCPDRSPFDLPPGGGSPSEVDHYFAPERWDAEVANHHPGDGRDPVETASGKSKAPPRPCSSSATFTWPTAAPAADDFLDSHLRRDARTRHRPASSRPGASRAGLFAAAVTFALDRVRPAGGHPRLEVVLNGDVVNFLELKGRGGTVVSRKHLPFYRTLDALAGRGSVVWLRGNHDYVVPAGPWRRGEFYANPAHATPGRARRRVRRRKLAARAGQQGVPAGDPGRLAVRGPRRRRRPGHDQVPDVRDRQPPPLERRRHPRVPRPAGQALRRAAAIAAVLGRLKYLGAADDSAAQGGAEAAEVQGVPRLARRPGAHARARRSRPASITTPAPGSPPSSPRAARKSRSRRSRSCSSTATGPAGGSRRTYTADQPEEGGPASARLHTPSPSTSCGGSTATSRSLLTRPAIGRTLDTVASPYPGSPPCASPAVTSWPRPPPSRCPRSLAGGSINPRRRRRLASFGPLNVGARATASASSRWGSALKDHAFDAQPLALLPLPPERRPIERNPAVRPRREPRRAAGLDCSTGCEAERNTSLRTVVDHDEIGPDLASSAAMR